MSLFSSLASRKGPRLTALAVLSLLLILVLLEVALQIAGFPVLPRYIYVEYHPERGWQNIPYAEGYAVTSEYTVHLEYNARGIRGRAVEFHKPPGTYRVLLVGGSFVEGTAVSQEDRVVEILEARLNRAGLYPQVEVIGFGTRGYATDQELLWLKSAGLAYEPDLVVLMFFYDDVWFNSRPASYSDRGKPAYLLSGDTLLLTNVPVPLPPDGDVAYASVSAGELRLVRLREWLTVKSNLYRLVTRAVKNTTFVHDLFVKAGLAMPRATVRTTVKIPTHDAVNVYREPTPAEFEHAWEVTRALLRRMKDDVEDVGAAFVIFLIPLRANIYLEEWRSMTSPLVGRWDGDAVAKRFGFICEKEYLACIEPTREFRAAAETMAAQGERVYYEIDGQWNANGNRLAARILVDYVQREPFGANQLAP